MKQREIVGTVRKGRSARIWLGSMPARFSFETSNWLSQSIPMRNTIDTYETRSAALTLLMHDRFGQLGVVFVPQEVETLEIKIGIADLEIAGLLIRRGIPAEFAQAILEETITTANEINFFGAGILEFNHG